MEDLTFEQWNAVVGVNLTGAFLCAQEAIRMMKAQQPQGRPHHQQRLHLRARAAPPFRALHRHQARHHRAHQDRISLDGRAHDIACGQIDIGNAATEMTERMTAGVPQANGTMAVEPRMDVRHVADAVLYMAQSAARRQRSVHDRHGDPDAVHRPRLTRHRSKGYSRRVHPLSVSLSPSSSLA